MSAIASLQTVLDVRPIEGADKIECATVLGWDCVVRKGTFKPGDIALYIEIDTVIPVFFLSGKPEDIGAEHHLRTVKMKGQLSQGLLLPVQAIRDYFAATGKQVEDDTQYLGKDLSELLGIRHYEKAVPIHLGGDAISQFPTQFPITDEEKIQSDPDLLKRLWGKPYYITMKLDGTSGTFFKTMDGEFGVCSRRLRLKDGPNVYWEMARRYHIEDWLPRGCCIQGEVVGPGIQKNKLAMPSTQLRIFNVFGATDPLYPDLYKKISFPLCKTLFEKSVEFVPVIEVGEAFNYTMEELISMANQLHYECGNRAEGMVVRSPDQRISFKVLNNNYLLEEKE